jgi:hypothetical protein
MTNEQSSPTHLLWVYSGAIELIGAQNVTIADNRIQCNQPTAHAFAAISGRSVQTPLALIDGLIVSQNHVGGRCKTLALLAPFINTRPFVPVGSVSITENQTQGLSVGVTFEGPILPLVKPRISDNLFLGTAPANFVKGPPGFTFDGSNGPQP